MLSVPALIANLLEPPIGILGDSWRRFTLIALGGLAFATSMLMFAGASHEWHLLAALALMYPASGTFVSLSQSTMMDTMRGNEERGMVVWTLAGSLGVALGPLLVAGAIALGSTWRSVYAGVAFGAVMATLGLLAVAPRDGVSRSQHRPRFVEVAVEAWRALKQRALLKWLALLAVIDLLLQVFVAYLALYFVDEVGSSPATAALAVTVWTIFALAGEALLVLLLRRFDGLTVVRSSAWLVALLLPAFLLTPAATVKLALVAALGLFSAGWYSILKAQFYRTLEGRSGAAMAIDSLFGSVTAIFPVIVGLTAGAHGLSIALWLVMLAPVSLAVALRQSSRG